MNFRSQLEAMSQLQRLADADRHSVLIEGPAGSGKSYLAKQYTNMLNVGDFVQVAPKVADLKECIESSITSENRIAVCIENLDTGVASASYAILKFLEEPTPNVYIIVTCRNVRGIPDTIISRSTVVTTTPPMPIDLAAFAKQKNLAKYNLLHEKLVWQCVRTFHDAEEVLDMTNDHIQYYEDLATSAQFTDNVSNTVWNIGHYPDNSECNIELALRAIMIHSGSRSIQKYAIEALTELTLGRIAQHAVLAKFVFNSKYWE